MTIYTTKGYQTKINKHYLIAVKGSSIINQRITNTPKDLKKANHLLK